MVRLALLAALALLPLPVAAADDPLDALQPPGCEPQQVVSGGCRILCVEGHGCIICSTPPCAIEIDEGGNGP